MNKHGQTLAALLVAVAIIALLAAVLLVGPSVFGGKKPPPRADNLGNTAITRPKFEAQDEVCRSNIHQIRQAIQISQTTEDRVPSSIDELPSVRSIAKCPIGGETYTYDAMSGTVSCPHPGHERF